MRRTKARGVLLGFAMAAGLAGTSLAWAHGGEDHDAPPPAVSVPVAPRGAARSEAFEAVAVLQDQKIELYLDRYASNEPVTGAKVEIESAAIRGQAAETAPGLYVLAADALPAARHALTLSIETAEEADLLTLSLDTGVTETNALPARHWPLRALGAGVSAVLALAGLLLWRRGRRSRRNLAS